jgi:conjugative transposon TraK protein
MEFTKAKNIEKAFQHIRAFTIIIILLAFAFSGYVVWESGEKVAAAQSQIYILSSGKALEAFASDRKDNIPVEARDHIRNFHTLFFSLDPDEKVINANLAKALYLADGSAKRLYDNLKETGYYAGVISGNISQQITVDSVSLNLDTYPFYFRCYATIKIIRPTSVVTRDLITEGFLRNVSRSDNNPHGFLIERWNTIENKDLKVETR